MRKALVIVILFMVVLTSFALAGDNAVSLDKSSVEDGQSDVPVDVVIELEFTNNVVNKSVAQSNAACIALRSNGEGVPVIIDMADDQIEPDLKRIINVIPAQNLAEGTQYVLTISAELSGKNGNTIGEDVIITFTTQGQAPKSSFAKWWPLLFVAAAVIVVFTVAFVSKRNGKKK